MDVDPCDTPGNRRIANVEDENAIGADVERRTDTHAES